MTQPPCCRFSLAGVLAVLRDFEIGFVLHNCALSGAPQGLSFPRKRESRTTNKSKFLLEFILHPDAGQALRTIICPLRRVGADLGFAGH